MSVSIFHTQNEDDLDTKIDPVIDTNSSSLNFAFRTERNGSGDQLWFSAFLFVF